VAPMTVRVLAPNPGLMTGTGTNTYLVHGDTHDVVVVDPGPDDPRHLAAILEAARPLGRIAACLVTHRHTDHLPGAVALRAQVGSPIVGHPLLPGVDKALPDGAAFATGPGTWLVALHTPGHTDDSVCFWDSSGRGLFTGDLIAGAGTVVVDETPGGMARYMASLRRLRQLGPCTIHPGHGPLVADGQATIQQYIDHRDTRERQILALLADGPITVAMLVGRLYATIVPELAPMAARNVRAHLGKLADEGRAQAVDETWRLASAADRST